MSRGDIPIHLDFNVDQDSSKSANNGSIGRRRSNSQSQVILQPTIELYVPQRHLEPDRKKRVQYFVSLVSLNDTFVNKHISVPYFPDTRKLGRPTGTKIKPDVTNGFFDSRVLSRNHAAMYIDPDTGKLMLKDLGSSNGTYVNNQKLDTEPIEVKIGDNICFGFNIQVGINHKQISCKIDNINIMNDLMASSSPASDSVEFKHYQHIQDLFNKIHQSEKPPFESALFSDLNPDTEDSLLGLYTRANNGIFKNSGTATSTRLETSINLLIKAATKIKQQNQSLALIEDFMDSYSRNVDDLNRKYLDNQFKTKLNDLNAVISKERTNSESLRADLTTVKDETAKKMKKLEEKIFILKNEKLTINKKYTELMKKQEDIEEPKLAATEKSLPSTEDPQLESQRASQQQPSEYKEEDQQSGLPFKIIPSGEDTDNFDPDNDLRYPHNHLFIGLSCLILGIIIHKMTM